MTITELIAQYRRESRDSADGQLASDAHVIELFNEAVDEACTRGQLLFDDSTADVCEVDVSSGTATYDLHSSIVHITRAYLEDANGDHIHLEIKDRPEMDRDNPEWRAESDEPEYLFVDDTTMRLVPEPADAYTMHLEVYRTPIDAERLTAPVAADPQANPPVEASDPSPVIAAHHHRHLVHWVLSQVFAWPDADLFDKRKADRHAELFTRYFGLPTTADRMRDKQVKRRRTNRLW